MSQLWLPRGKSKPSIFAPALDKASTLYPGINLASIVNEGGGAPIELVDNKIIRMGSGGVWDVGELGRATRGTGASSHVDCERVTQQVDQCTVYVLFEYAGAGGSEQGLWTQYLSTDGGNNNFFCNVIFTTAAKARFETYAGSFTNSICTTTPTDGVIYGVAGRMTGAARSIWFGEHGSVLVKEDEDAYSSTLTPRSNGNCGFNAHHRFSNTYSRCKTFAVFYWADRWLNDEQLQALHADPWQLIEDYSSRVWAIKAPAAGGGGGSPINETLSLGTSAGLATASIATIEGAIALAAQAGFQRAGALSVDLAATLDAAAAVAGAADIVFDTNLALAAVADIAQDRNLSIDASATLASAASIAASALVAYENQITLASAAGLTGAALGTFGLALSFDTQAALANTGGFIFESAAALDAIADIALLPGTAFEASVSLPVAAGISLARNVTINGAVSLGASVGLTSAVTQVLGVAIALGATADLTMAANGVLVGVVTLPGSTGMTAAAAGSAYGVSIELDGSAGLSASGGLSLSDSISVGAAAGIAVAAAIAQNSKHATDRLSLDAQQRRYSISASGRRLTVTAAPRRLDLKH